MKHFFKVAAALAGFAIAALFLLGKAEQKH